MWNGPEKDKIKPQTFVKKAQAEVDDIKDILKASKTIKNIKESKDSFNYTKKKMNVMPIGWVFIIFWVLSTGMYIYLNPVMFRFHTLGDRSGGPYGATVSVPAQPTPEVILIFFALIGLIGLIILLIDNKNVKKK